MKKSNAIGMITAIIFAVIVLGFAGFMAFNAIFSDKFSFGTVENEVLNDTTVTTSTSIKEDTTNSSIKSGKNTKNSSKKATSAAVKKTESKNKNSTSSTKKAEKSEIKINVPKGEQIVKVYNFSYKAAEPKCVSGVFRDAFNGVKYPYKLFLPQDYDTKYCYPVLIYLHGASEAGTDNIVQANTAKKMYEYNADLVSQAFVLCPQTTDIWNLESVIGLLNKIKSEYACDDDRIYVTGVSGIGGRATWDLLANYNDIFAAGMPMCSWGNQSRVDSLTKVPIKIFHGTDDTTVPYTASKNMYDEILRAGGLKVDFVQLYGFGHDIADYVFHNRDAFCWLFAQDKAYNKKGKYEYIPYFELIDSDGNTVISDADIEEVSDFENEDGNSYTIKIVLTEDGQKALSKAYASGPHKRFTVYWLDQKLYTYIPNKTVVTEKFELACTFDEETSNIFTQTVNLSCRDLK